MQVQSGDDRRRHVVDDIDLFRMQPSYEDGEQSQQATRATASSTEAKKYALNYEYRSRDEVANAILKLRGKEKQAEYVNIVQQAQRARSQQNPRRDVAEISKVANEPAVIAEVVTHSHSSHTATVPEHKYPSQNNMSVTRSFATKSVTSRTAVNQEAGEKVISSDAQGSQNNMSVTRSFATKSVTSRTAINEEAGEKVTFCDTQGNYLRIEPKTEPTFANTASKKTKPAGLFGSLFRCGFCATDAQLPDFVDVDEVKEYSIEGVANHIQGLKIETSSQFLSPPPPSAYIHVAPCNVVQHSESIGGCSTITHSVAGKIAVRDDGEDVRGHASTTKHSNLSASVHSLIDRDVEAGGNEDHQLVEKMPSVQVPSHEQMSVQVPSHEQMSSAEYESLGLGSKEAYSKRYMASRSASLSFMSVAGKGTSMGLSSASELGTETQSQSFTHMSSASELDTETQSQSFSHMSPQDDGDTFSSASEGASEEDSDYTLSDGSSIYDSFALSSYVSSMQEDDSMTYGTSLSGSSSSDSYYE